MKLIHRLQSKQDSSVNFVFDNKLEARFVRREKDYFIAYLSSQNGCNQACRFCHLTQSKQTLQEQTSIAEYITQANKVLDHYVLSKEDIASRVNFNFMARGEPFLNPSLIGSSDKLFGRLHELSSHLNLEPTFNVSTIMPSDSDYQNPNHLINGRAKRFNHLIYYSLYSTKEAFRKRWLPKALDVPTALSLLKNWQDKTSQTLVFHHAFIKDENDSLEDVERFLEAIRPFHFYAKFNLVRYNPYSSHHGQESHEEILERNFQLIIKEMKAPGSRIVPRVGKDVMASCGMFIQSK